MSLKEQISENAAGNEKLQKEEKKKKEYEPRKVQYSYFAMILYPQEDINHKLILEELIRNKTEFPKLLYITHDRDIYTEDITNAFGDIHAKGELKKEHTHVLFKTRKKSTPGGLIRHFDGLINYIEGVENEYCYATYMTHENAVCIAKGKPIYQRTELKGDKEFIQDLFIQNLYSTQFYEVLKISQECNNIYTLFEKVKDDKDLFEIVKANRIFFIHAQNQINNQKFNAFVPTKETVRSDAYKNLPKGNGQSRAETEQSASPGTEREKKTKEEKKEKEQSASPRSPPKT